jgi:solute:Na+ symporter, SSS family
MYVLTTAHLVSIVLTLAVVSAFGVYAGKQVKSASDFSVGGRKAGSSLVAGTIMGTLVGGASTVGTAELAFKFGMSAWWFTLGAGIACLLLGVFLARPLRESGLETVPQFLVTTYGPKAGPVASVFSSIGIFLNIIGQILAAIALLSSMFQIGPIPGAMISIVLVIFYVLFGGVMGTGIVGIVKFVLLYASLIVSGVLAYSKVGGVAGLTGSLPSFPWFSLFGRGFSIDFAAGFSLIVGVLSTQTYLQAMFSGKDVKASRRGALISAILIPPSGFAGILVGMYMKLNFPKTAAAEALPTFVIKFLPPWIGGVVLATLLVAVIGTAAGLSLGISTMLTKDIYKKFVNPDSNDTRVLLVSRVLLVVVLGLTLLFVTGNLKSMILQWSFLSMGLRGATICLPLLGAIFFKNFVTPKGGLIALTVGPVADLVWKLAYPKGIDPLYVGLLASLVCLIIGSLVFPVPKSQKISG